MKSVMPYKRNRAAIVATFVISTNLPIELIMWIVSDTEDLRVINRVSSTGTALPRFAYAKRGGIWPFSWRVIHVHLFLGGQLVSSKSVWYCKTSGNRMATVQHRCLVFRQ